MKRSAKVMSLVLACAVTPVIVPQASAQTQPANPGTPPAVTQTPQQTPPAQQQTPPAQQQKQTQQQKNSQGTANRARGAAGGAVIGGMMGHAGAGALIGAGHSRREQRRANRHGQ